MGNFTSTNTIQVADKYKNCETPLGHGTYGHVDKYREKSTKKYVAVKTIDVSKLTNLGEHWEREINVWLKIEPHPNVVPLLDHWIVNGNIRAVMPLAKCNLSEYVRERGREKEERGSLVDSNVLVDMSQMVLEGTSHLHNSTPPIIHRDLKPANILCFDEDGRFVLKIADFGISKLQEKDKSTQAHTVGVGTRYFQAPEVIKGQPYSKAVDVWSLGVVLFYLTTGGEYPYFIYIDDWHHQLPTINNQELWNFGNSFFKLDRNVETIRDVINKMIVIEKSMRVDIDGARKIISEARMEAMETSEKIREAGEKKYPGYSPSVSDIREAADLVNTGYLTSLRYLRLKGFCHLSSSDEADIKSVLSVCTDRVSIDKVRGCGLVIKHVNSKVLWICGETLSASETSGLVTSMRDRVESVVLFSGVTLDVNTVDTRIGDLRQGTCTEIQCWWNTRDKYREHLTRWADTIGWRTEDMDNSNIRIYK